LANDERRHWLNTTLSCDSSRQRRPCLRACCAVGCIQDSKYLKVQDHQSRRIASRSWRVSKRGAARRFFRGRVEVHALARQYQVLLCVKSHSNPCQSKSLCRFAAIFELLNALTHAKNAAVNFSYERNTGKSNSTHSRQLVDHQNARRRPATRNQDVEVDRQGHSAKRRSARTSSADVCGRSRNADWHLSGRRN
jgi:hypothetical protein